MKAIHEMTCEYCGIDSMAWEPPKTENHPILCAMCRMAEEATFNVIMKRAHQKAAEKQIDDYNARKQRLLYEEGDDDTHEDLS